MKKEWKAPKLSVVSVDLEKCEDAVNLSDAELKIELEQAGYKFQKIYQASDNYIHRKIADAEVLISVGSNIADFNGYIELNNSAATLWEKLQEPCLLRELEMTLEEDYGITHEEAVADVLDFLKKLMKHHMVEVQ